MSEFAMNPSKRQRKSVPKSSAGCITCKLRHVRCDEQKPACARCMKSGRQCDGYSIDGRRPNQDPLKVVLWQPNTLAVHRLSVDVPGNGRERRAFQFFREKSAADFPGFFESSFWGRLVLQASHAEPSIRHAVIALGSLHELIRHNEWKVGRAYDSFALQQSNKAIGHLNQNIGSTEQPSTEMLLMSCAIFICIESLQGNYESALRHIEGGVRIFRHWQAESSRCSSPRTARSSPHHQSVDNEIIQIFSRLNVQTLLFPDTHLLSKDVFKQDVLPIIDPVPVVFTTVEEARACLDDCISYKLQAMVVAYLSRQGSGDGSVGPPQDCTDEHLLRQWSVAFDALVERAGPSQSPQNIQRAIILEMQYKCVKILLSVGLPPTETAFDDFEALFESIISLATSVIHASSSGEISERTGHFSFETGLVPPLYFTATRCRDPWVRRQALSLLSSRPRQECVWNSEMMFKIAERIILVEEGRDDIGQVTSSEVILVTSRLSVLNATIDAEKRKVLVECLQWKCGPDEEMRLLNEWIEY